MNNPQSNGVVAIMLIKRLMGTKSCFRFLLKIPQGSRSSQRNTGQKGGNESALVGSSTQ